MPKYSLDFKIKVVKEYLNGKSGGKVEFLKNIIFLVVYCKIGLIGSIEMVLKV